MDQELWPQLLRRWGSGFGDYTVFSGVSKLTDLQAWWRQISTTHPERHCINQSCWLWASKQRISSVEGYQEVVHGVDRKQVKGGSVGKQTLGSREELRGSFSG